MQEPGAGAGGAAGGGGEEGEHSGQSSPRAPEDQRSPGRSPAGEGRNDDDVREPCGPQDPGNEAAAGNPDEGRPVQQGGAGEEAAAAPQGAQAPLACGPSADVMELESPVMEFCVMVHFRSPLEAVVAHRSLISNAQHQEVMIQEEFTVADSALAMWMTEDLFLFQDLINNFLDQLFEVMRNIQCLELVAIAQRGRGMRRPES